jgi:hypothetical protein
MSDDADTIIKHQALLESRRANFDTWWQDIAYRVLPADAQFTTIDAEGTKRTERLFDATAAKNNRKFAAILEDMATPLTQRWHGLESQSDELTEDQEVDEYLDAETKALFKARYRFESMFAANRSKNYLNIGAFGNAVLFVDEVMGFGAKYLSCHMREITYAEDTYGRIDTLYRKFNISGRNAVKRFGDQLSAKLKGEMSSKPFDTWAFIHCTRPNEERISGRIDAAGMPFAYEFLSLDDKSIVEHGGYPEWPWSISRYSVAVGETYARSPAMECWPAIMTLQEQKKTILRAGQKEVDPPVLLTDEGVLGQFNLKSSALNYGGLSSDGSVLAAPFKTGANIPLGLELMQLEKGDVDDSFLTSLWSMIVNENVETAAQVFELARMRSINIAPVYNRLVGEDLGPLIKRERGILHRRNMALNGALLPQMPRQLMEAGDEVEPEYTSPLARTMRAQDGVAILRTFEVAEAAGKVDPKALNVLRAPEMLRELAEISGVPAKLLRSLDEIEAMGAAQDADEAEVAAAAVAPELSQAALNAAKASELRGGSPVLAPV